MNLFLKRLKEAFRILVSKDTILNLSIDQIIGILGESNIKTFVQIGSNDGIKNDPLHPYIIKNEWKGILVEPDPQNFRKLVKNYSQVQGLIFENLGIAPEKGEMIFYRIKNIGDQEPGWYDQVGSFDKSTFLKNIRQGKDLTQRISTEPVQVIGFDELLKKNNFFKVDVLHMDAEGFDYCILRSIDFDNHNIPILIFEGEWMSQAELKEIIRHLREQGYQIFRSGIDYAGVRIAGR